MGQDGCLAHAPYSGFPGRCELCGGWVWGQTCRLCHVSQPIPCHWGTPEGKGTPPKDCVPQFPQVGVCGGVLGFAAQAACRLRTSLLNSLFLPLSSPPTCPRAPRRPPSSVSSAKGGVAWPSGAQTCSPSSTYRYRSLAQPPAATTRLSSVSSHDSGFISQDAAYSKPPSPMPSDITSQVRGQRRPPLCASVSPSVEWMSAAGSNRRVWRGGDGTHTHPQGVFPAVFASWEINIGNIDRC